MQHKIPVQIENEDPIFLWLSLRQLTIIMIWWGIAYTMFKSMAPNFWAEISLIPTIFVIWLALTIALFKKWEMTFFPFILAILRFNVNSKTRKRDSWVDSFQAIDIWYISSLSDKKEEKIDFKSKIDKIKELKWEIDSEKL